MWSKFLLPECKEGFTVFLQVTTSKAWYTLVDKIANMCLCKQSSAIVHRQVAGVDAWQKVPDHVGFVPQQSTDKISDLSTDNRRFCLQVCTKAQVLR